MNAERQYIALCKRLIEERLHIEQSEGMLRQRDLEYLAKSIEEKSGIKLSLSTLKRLWRKDYHQTPHPSTLGALASLIGYKDWQDFKSNQAISAVFPDANSKTGHRAFSRWILLLGAAALFGLYWLVLFQTREARKSVVIKGPVTFKANKTISKGVPNTIIFNYDVTNIEADSFFFQQSWNDREKVKIDRHGHYHSTIYYYPGFHRAKLIANDSVVGRFNAHITTDDWMPLLSYSNLDKLPIYIKKPRPVSSGTLHITRDDLVFAKIDADKEFMLSYFNVREFENTHSDNFSLDTRIVCDSSATIACPGFELVVLCEGARFFVRLMGKGCERDIAVKIGEVVQKGISNDLSVFGRDLHQWQDLQIKISNKQAIIYLGKEPVHRITFKEDFGKVIGLIYHFNGTGAVDYVKLKNRENKLVFEDDFGG